MSGKYNGLQARIKEMNPYAEFVPCFLHSLNLIGNYAAECNEEAANFFLLKSCILFFAITHRWDLLTLELHSQGGFPLFGSKTALRHKVVTSV